MIKKVWLNGKLIIDENKPNNIIIKLRKENIMKYKVGERVRETKSSYRGGEECTIISIESGEFQYKIRYDDGETNRFMEKGLLPILPPLEDMPEGRVIEHDTIGEKKVLFAFKAGLYQLSKANSFDKAGKVCTAKELIMIGWRIKDQEDIEELTTEEVCKELGREVKIKD